MNALESALRAYVIRDPTAKDLAAACAESPQDFHLQRVLADRLDELGDVPSALFAGALRWMADHQKAPLKRSDRKKDPWLWVASHEAYKEQKILKADRTDTAVLGVGLLPGYRDVEWGWRSENNATAYTSRSYPSWEEAALALAVKLLRSGQVGDAGPDLAQALAEVLFAVREKLRPMLGWFPMGPMGQHVRDHVAAVVGDIDAAVARHGLRPRTESL